jgi:hypothetical protein
MFLLFVVVVVVRRKTRIHSVEKRMDQENYPISKRRF